MQPPPRKVKVTQELKNIHVEQMTRLHLKHQTECELLEDMRTYSQKKAAIERDYAQQTESSLSTAVEWSRNPPPHPSSDPSVSVAPRACDCNVPLGLRLA